MIRRDAPSASLLSQLPWLFDANSWGLAPTPGMDAPAVGGAWPLGNGRVFAHAGPALPASRLSGIVGPTYGSASFGDCWLELVSERQAVSLPYQEIWRPRESGVLVTHAHDRAVSLVTFDYAPPGHRLLLRVIEIWRGDRLGTDARLVAHLPRGELHESRRRSLRVSTEHGVLILSALAPGRLASPGRIEIPVGDVPASGGVRRVVLVLATGQDEEQAFGGLPQLLHPITLLELTRAFWHTWLRRTATPDLWPQNFPGPTSTTRSLHDLIESAKLALKMQQADPGGALPAMASQEGTSVRGMLGPIRALLAIGAREEAQAALEHQYRSAIVLGHVSEAPPPDIKLTGLAAPGDWSQMPLPDPDTAAFVILPHRWWLESGGDTDLVHRHWDYLRRCATPRQPVPGAFVLPAHRAVHPAVYLATLFPERCGWPNDLVAVGPADGSRPLLLDTLAAYVAAQDAMAWMGERLGRGQEARGHLEEAARARAELERLFWMEERGHYAPAVYPLSAAPHEAPCAPINLMPLWLGYHAGEQEKARRDLAAVVDLVGFRGSTPNCEHLFCSAAAQLSWNLTATASDLAPLALANLAALASPGGAWAAAYGPGEGPPGLWPCETGTALDAIYYYFASRTPADEPTHELRGVTRDGKTLGPGPVRSFHMSPPRQPQGVVVVTAEPADAADQTVAPATVIEPGLPFGADYFQQLLFDPATGQRRVHQLVLGQSALAGDTRSMKPAAFWHLPDVTRALERFETEGGRLVRPG
jgi:hypothetical protein